MKRLIPILLLFALTIPAAGDALPPARSPVAGNSLTPEAAPATGLSSTPVIDVDELRTALRELWTGHVFWVRNVALAAHYEDATGLESAHTKAVENARALADSIEPFYGQDASDALFELLAGHYGAIREYLTARTGANASGARTASENLVANAREIAGFLDGANPYLPKDTVQPLLIAHGGHHMKQIDQIHEGDFEAEAQTWDEMLAHIYSVSDAMAGALAKQFPDKVSG